MQKDGSEHQGFTIRSPRWVDVDSHSMSKGPPLMVALKVCDTTWPATHSSRSDVSPSAVGPPGTSRQTPSPGIKPQHSPAHKNSSPIPSNVSPADTAPSSPAASPLSAPPSPKLNPEKVSESCHRSPKAQDLFFVQACPGKPPIPNNSSFTSTRGRFCVN